MRQATAESPAPPAAPSMQSSMGESRPSDDIGPMKTTAVNDRVGRGRKKKGSLLAFLVGLQGFLASDAGYESMQVAKLFVMEYAGYVVVPVLVGCMAAGGYGVADRWGRKEEEKGVAMAMMAAGAATMMLWLWVAATRRRKAACYLVGYGLAKPLDSQKLSTLRCVEVTHCEKGYTTKSLLFQLKLLLRSGLGEETYGPKYFFQEGAKKENAGMVAGRDEARDMLSGAMDSLLRQTGLRADQIDCLIVTCSMFYPTPSMCSILVNHYKMRADVKTFNLSGMGCSASLLAVNLAVDLLRAYPGMYVVVAGTESITLNWYSGNEKSMLVPNCLFRCGGYAVLLSGRASDRRRAKMRLVASVRATTAASDDSYGSVFSREDAEGHRGVALSLSLLDVAGHALRLNIGRLLPPTMPFRELLKAVLAVCRPNGKPYIPDFHQAFSHFCIHPGGRAIIDGIGKNLGLSEYDMEPSKMALHRFGNTSSSGIWYVLGYLEAKDRLKPGECIWQVSLGSGFKCNSVVWKVLGNVQPKDECNPWFDRIDQYPVNVIDTITPDHRLYPFVREAEMLVAAEAKAAFENREEALQAAVARAYAAMNASDAANKEEAKTIHTS